MNVQHSSKSVEHYTPFDIVERARLAMGSIDLDPASCEEANRTVQAIEYLTKDDDGLAFEWAGNVFLNPPGGTFTARRPSKNDPKVETSNRDKVARAYWGTDSRAVAWWRKLIAEYGCGRVQQAVFVGFSLEILQQSQDGVHTTPVQHTFCIPAKRIAFSGGKQPTHGNVIVYLGPDAGRFDLCFSPIGEVRL